MCIMHHPLTFLLVHNTTLRTVRNTIACSVGSLRNGAYSGISSIRWNMKGGGVVGKDRKDRKRENCHNYGYFQASLTFFHPSYLLFLSSLISLSFYFSTSWTTIKFQVYTHTHTHTFLQTQIIPAVRGKVFVHNVLLK